MVASETIYEVHENQSVKRSGQAGGAAHVAGLNGQFWRNSRNSVSFNRCKCCWGRFATFWYPKSYGSMLIIFSPHLQRYQLNVNK
ncbi:hypothetical protein DMR07_23525 [Citrobacter freundii]|nr:hypothetical protein DMR07_23525 [Citrobacter freundii]